MAKIEKVNSFVMGGILHDVYEVSEEGKETFSFWFNHKSKYDKKYSVYTDIPRQHKRVSSPKTMKQAKEDMINFYENKYEYLLKLKTASETKTNLFNELKGFENDINKLNELLSKADNIQQTEGIGNEDLRYAMMDFTRYIYSTIKKIKAS